MNVDDRNKAPETEVRRIAEDSGGVVHTLMVPAEPNSFEQKTWEPSNGEVAWTYDEIIAREA